MSKTTTLLVGLEGEEDSISVAYAEDKRAAEVVFGGQIGPRQGTTPEMLKG